MNRVGLFPRAAFRHPQVIFCLANLRAFIRVQHIIDRKKLSSRSRYTVLRSMADRERLFDPSMTTALPPAEKMTSDPRQDIGSRTQQHGQCCLSRSLVFARPRTAVVFGVHQDKGSQISGRRAKRMVIFWISEHPWGVKLIEHPYHPRSMCHICGRTNLGRAPFDFQMSMTQDQRSTRCFWSTHLSFGQEIPRKLGRVGQETTGLHRKFPFGG